MMAIRMKSKIHTVIFSIILILLESWGTVSAQHQQLQQTKDQNVYFQSPQRFQSPFPASRNGFFPTNGLPNTGQNFPQSLPRSQLGGALQQPQDQSAFFGAIPAKNDGSTSDYFQYSAFPAAPPQQQENFFQISPRPFAIQSNSNHGVHFVRPPIVPQSQQYTADQNKNHFAFPQQSFQEQRPQTLHPNAEHLEQRQSPAIQQQHQQQSIAHQKTSVARVPAITVYDATKFVKQGQGERLLNNDSTVNHRSSNNISIRNSVRKSNESATSQENGNENNRFPNTRNRFHPLSTTKPMAMSRTTPTIAAKTQSTTLAPATVAPTSDRNLQQITSDQRQNRIPISSRFGTSREQNTNIRINKFLRQPLYTSREIDQQQTPKRINITHNGSTNRDGAGASQEVSNRTHQLQLLQQARQKIRESSGETVPTPAIQQGIISRAPQEALIENQPSIETTDDDDDEEEEEFFYDDESIDMKDDEGIKTTRKPTSEENKPVILTSNFFLPGKPIPKLKQQHDFDNQEPNDLSSDIGGANGQQKDNAEDVIDSIAEKEIEIVERTTKKFVAPKTSTTSTTTTAKTTKATSKISPKPLDSNGEYEYYDDYVDEPTTTETNTSPEPATDQGEQTTNHVLKEEEIEEEKEQEQEQEEKRVKEDEKVEQEKELGEQIEEQIEEHSTIDNAEDSDFTEKTVQKSIKSNTSNDQIEMSVEPVETSSVSTTEPVINTGISTEGYVVASVQTSRSISSARFLTFPQVEQEEKSQSLGDTQKDVRKINKDDDYSSENASYDDSKDSNQADDLVKSIDDKPKITVIAEEEADDSTEKTSPASAVQSKNESETLNPDVVKSRTHKLSSISEKLAHLHEVNEPKAELTTKSVPVVIRKFAPRTTRAPAHKLPITSTKPNFYVDDELASSLPPGNRAQSTTPKAVTTTEKIDILRKIQFKEISLEGLLPKDYKPTQSESKHKAEENVKKDKQSNILSKNNFDDSIKAHLPKDYKLSTVASVTKAPFRLSTVTEDISKFLPPGFELQKESTITTTTTNRPQFKTTMDDISKFLPPGYRLPKSTSTEKPETVTPKNDESSDERSSLLNKLSFNTDISSLLPTGFKANSSEDDSVSKKKTDEKLSSSSGTSGNSGFKLVFPKGIGKRPGVRLTTPRPSYAEGPTAPGITIRKGLPTRATTVFTGWPTVSTTPLSIEKIFEQQGAQSIDISEILRRTSSSTSTTIVTTTTTTTTVRPTQPGLCHSQCDLAGTIKIVDGVKWKPELLDHNTVEYKNLAKEIEIQLNDVYSKADRLKKWFKKIRIDSFSQGSVLVDYFVELADVSRDINTQEIKKMFHDALTEVPMTVVPLKNNGTASSMDMEQIIAEFPENAKPARTNYLMGDFILDPLATDFIVIPKHRVIPTTQNEIEVSIIPQWAIAVIVIGAGSLLFVVIFGAAVLINRQKRSKKKAPVPLTADMLNELNKNHMGGFENYGHEELYIEDTWDDVKPDSNFKPKRFANSSDRDERFDSWRTNQAKYQADADYYYDQKLSKPHYSQKSYAYPQNDPYMDNFHPQYHPSYSSSHQHPAQQNAMGLYTYNTRRYNRDYDPDF